MRAKKNRPTQASGGRLESIVTKWTLCKNRTSIKQASKCMTKKIALSGKRGTGKFALIDDSDYERVSCYKWNVDYKGYARAHIALVPGQTKHVKLHRFVMSAPRGVLVDHINRDRLDCRQSNLRFCTDSENQRNWHRPRLDGGYRGVHLTPYGRWHVTIRVNKVRVHVGSYLSEESAALAYDAAALQLHGDFALLNSELL